MKTSENLLPSQILVNNCHLPFVFYYLCIWS